MRKCLLLLLSLPALAQDIHVKNGSGLVTADIVKNFNSGANGSCRDYQSSDTAAVVSSGRICGQFQSTTNFNFASIIFQTAINNTPTYQSNFEIRGDLTMRQHEQEIFDNAKLLEWLDTAGTGITVLDLDASNNVRIGAQLNPLTNGDLYLFNRGVQRLQLVANTLSPFTDFGSNLGGVGGTDHPWGTLNADAAVLRGDGSSTIAQFVLYAQDIGSFTNVKGPTTGTNVAWTLPAAVPSAGDQLTASAVVGSTVTLGWSAGGCGGTCMTTNTSQTVTGTKTWAITQLFNNAITLQWKDTVGTSIPVVVLDSSNNVDIGAFVNPISNGELYLFNRGVQRLQLVANTFSPFTDFGSNLGGVGGADHPWGTLNADAAVLRGDGGSTIAQFVLYSQDIGSFTNIKGPTSGTNTAWTLPNSVPSTGDVLTASAVSGSSVTTAWVAPGGASCGGTCMTTNTNQTVTGLKTFSSSIDATSDNTYDLGQGATEWGNVYSTNFVSGIGGTRAGLVAIYNNTSGVYFGFQGSTGSGGNDVLAGPPLGNGSLAPAVAGTTDLGYSGRAWRSLYVNNIVASGVGGLSTTIAVRNSAGSASCTITYTNGIFTSSTC